MIGVEKGHLILCRLKAVFHLAEFSARSDIFSSKLSALKFDLISTSILSKAKMIRKRRNKLSAVEKEEAPGTHCIAKKTYSKAKAKIQEKILGQTDFLKNRMKKENCSLIQSLW